MVTTAPMYRNILVACSILVYIPNCKARYTVTTGPKY